MNAVEIEQAITELSELPFDQGEFAYQFLMAFGNKDTTIKRLRAGNNNKSDIPNGVLQRTNIHIGACGKEKSKAPSPHLNPALKHQKQKQNSYLQPTAMNSRRRT